MKEPKLTSLTHGGGCGCKISPTVLNEILSKTENIPIPPELIVGTETCDDGAVYKINDNLSIVVSTDFFMPVVDDPYNFGEISATNAISDIYAMGAKPIFSLAIVGMPVEILSTETISKILSGGSSICKKAGIPIAGGHTIDSSEPIYGLVVVGLVETKNLKKNSGSKIGDKLILGKPIGVGVYSAALKKNDLSVNLYERMIKYTTQLNSIGYDLGKLDCVNSITDITGFGLLGHSMEMALGSNKSIELFFKKIIFHDDVKQLVDKGFFTGASSRNWESIKDEIFLGSDLSYVDKILLTDPQTSGGLMVSVESNNAKEVLRMFHQQGYTASEVGNVIKKNKFSVMVY